MHLQFRTKIWLVAALFVVGCGGGSGGDDAGSSQISSQPAGQASSMPTDAGGIFPRKTAAETFYEMYGVRAGLYEVVIESDGKKYVTQGRIIANERIVGPYWGFFPEFDVCHAGDYSWTTGDLHSSNTWGEVNTKPWGMAMGDWNIVLSEDPDNLDIVRGIAHDRSSGAERIFTLYRISDSRNYEGGYANLTTTLEGRETIVSSSVCWSMVRYPVVDGDGAIAFYHEEYFINIFPERGDEPVIANYHTRLMGVHIREGGDIRDGDDFRFSSEIYGPLAASQDIVSMGSTMINRVYDDYGNRRRQDDTFKIGVHAFRLDMVGVPGTALEGLLIKGTIHLHVPPGY